MFSRFCLYYVWEYECVMLIIFMQTNRRSVCMSDDNLWKKDYYGACRKYYIILWNTHMKGKINNNALLSCFYLLRFIYCLYCLSLMRILVGIVWILIIILICMSTTMIFPFKCSWWCWWVIQNYLRSRTSAPSCRRLMLRQCIICKNLW